MRRFIIYGFASIGVLTVLLAILALGAVWNLRASKPHVPDLAVLRLDLSRRFEDLPADDLFARLRGEQKSGFLPLLSALARAATDNRVKGLIARIDGTGLPLAKVQELRDAILKFRASGKFAYAYGEGMPGNKDIFLATAFDHITVQPMGGVGLTGLLSERLFLRGTLDKLGIEPEVERRRDYKTALNDILFTGFTAPEREMILSYGGSLSAQMIEGIAKGRGLAADDVRALIDRGPFTSDEAMKAKLIDRVGFPDEVREAALTKAGADGPKDKAQILPFAKYIAATQDSARTGAARIALVAATGPIVSHEGDVDATQVAADTFVKAIDKAVDEPDVKGILLRIDSPGGSASASESVRHALIRARKAGKPVVVSMSGVAASGGYWIAMSADAIIAEPTTLTGSIGVYSGKVNLEKLAADWGANFDRIQFGANAAIQSAGKPLSPTERERLSAQVDEVYNLFKAGVADGRNMTVEAVEKIAQGRVWTGAQAKDLGLVDQLGGLETAALVMRDKLKLPADAPIDLVPYPRPLTAVEAVLKGLGAEEDEARAGLRGQGTMIADWIGVAMTGLDDGARTGLSYRDLWRLSVRGEPLALTTAPVDWR